MEFRQAGILEGDTLLAANGVAVPRSEKWHLGSYRVSLMKLKPGEDVKLVWTRPGTGKMDGVVKACTNEPRHLSLRDPIEWEPPPRPKQE